jgi:hypothetical protein
VLPAKCRERPTSVTRCALQVEVPADEAKMTIAVYTTLALVVLSSSFVVVPVQEATSGALTVQVRLTSELNPRIGKKSGTDLSGPASFVFMQ